MLHKLIFGLLIQISPSSILNWSRTISEIIRRSIDGLVRDQSVLINSPSKMGGPLRTLRFVRLLLDKGAKVDVAGLEGNTALIKAARNGHENIVPLLLDRGANIEAKNKLGQTPIIRALDGTTSSIDIRFETVQLLIDRGANVGAVSVYGISVLHYAVLSKNLRAIDLLLRAGANLLAQNHDKKSPLDLARIMGYDQGAERLILELNRKKRDNNRQRRGDQNQNRIWTG